MQFAFAQKNYVKKSILKMQLFLHWRAIWSLLRLYRSFPMPAKIRFSGEREGYSIPSAFHVV